MATEESSSAKYPQLPSKSDINEPLISTTEPLSGEAKKVKRRNQDTPSSKQRHKKQQPLTESKKWDVEIAAVYIADAIHVRKPQTRIKDPGYQISVCNKTIVVSPLNAYKFVHNNYWKLFLYLMIWTHLLVIIVAPKNFNDQKNADKFNQVNQWVLIVQLFCLVVFIFDCALKIYSHDKTFRQDRWQRFLYLVILINTIHVILSFFGANVPQRLNLLSAIFRPYYLVYNARSLRDVIKNVLRSIPRIMVLLWVIAFIVCCFGLVGYELWWDVPQSNFNTFEESMLSLMILLTTANYPDVMMPAYHSSKFNVFFFALFVIIILVLFLPTLLAVVYEAYNSQTKKRYARITKISNEGLLRAFELLVKVDDVHTDGEYSTSHKSHSENKMSIFSKYGTMTAVELMTNAGNGDEDGGKEAVITESTWLHLMRVVRPDLDAAKQKVLFTTLRLNEEDLTAPPTQSEARLNHSDTPNGITKDQFMRLREFIEIKFSIHSKAGVAHELVKLQQHLTRYLRHKQHRTVLNRLKAFETKVRVLLLWMFSHPKSEAFIDWMVWVNAMTFIAEKCSMDVYHNHQGNYVFSIIHTSFLAIFIIEIVLKMYAYGLAVFVRDWFYVFDTILVVAGMVAWEISDDDDSYVQLIRALRLLRVLKEFPSMRLLALFLSALLRSFFILLLAQFCVFYIFAMVGMAKFDGLLGEKQIADRMATLNSNSTEYKYWQNHLGGEDATQRFYYLNNMNSFLNTIIVLMELSVVNNWQVVMEMYTTMSQSHYDRIFFIAFYFFSVIVVLNVVVAFVINLFLVNYGQNMSRNELLFRYKRYILMSILIHQLNDNEYDLGHWKIERRIRPALWYRIIFEDTVNSSIELANTAQRAREGVDNVVDYDDCVQMPFSEGTLIEQFQHLDKSVRAATYYGTMANDMLTPRSQYNVIGSVDNANGGIFGTPDKLRGSLMLNHSIGDVFSHDIVHSMREYSISNRHYSPNKLFVPSTSSKDVIN